MDAHKLLSQLILALQEKDYIRAEYVFNLLKQAIQRTPDTELATWSALRTQLDSAEPTRIRLGQMEG